MRITQIHRLVFPDSGGSLVSTQRREKRKEERFWLYQHELVLWTLAASLAKQEELDKLLYSFPLSSIATPLAKFTGKRRKEFSTLAAGPSIVPPTLMTVRSLP